MLGASGPARLRFSLICKGASTTTFIVIQKRDSLCTATSSPNRPNDRERVPTKAVQPTVARRSAHGRMEPHRRLLLVAYLVS